MDGQRALAHLLPGSYEFVLGHEGCGASPAQPDTEKNKEQRTP